MSESSRKTRTTDLYRYDPSRFRVYARDFTVWDGVRSSGGQNGSGTKSGIDVDAVLKGRSYIARNYLAGIVSILYCIGNFILVTMKSSVFFPIKFIAKNGLITGLATFVLAYLLLMACDKCSIALPKSSGIEYSLTIISSRGNFYKKIDLLEERIVILEKQIFSQKNHSKSACLDSSICRGNSYPILSLDVIKEWTSSTYEMEKFSVMMYPFYWIYQNFYTYGEAPYISLESVTEESTISSSCWFMEGNKGHIGMRLSSPARISHVTIKSNYPASHSIKNVNLWGEMSRNETITLKHGILTNEGGKINVPSVSTLSDLALLASFEYKPDIPSMAQTFSIGQAARSSGLLFEKLLLQITDNWGSKEYTCLQHVSIHGI